MELATMQALEIGSSKPFANLDSSAALTDYIPTKDGPGHQITILNFRNFRHKNRVVDELVNDKIIAFHGWGVSGVGRRVDVGSPKFRQFWEVKHNRPLAAKIPLLEPPEDSVRHTDWGMVHPDFRYLSDPKALRKIWQDIYPMHLIMPYNQAGESLSEAVVTPAFDPDAAPNTPVPTYCLFWVEDPALKGLVKGVKDKLPSAQLGVSSLNDPGEIPAFNTPELLDYLKSKGINYYDLVIRDPLLEGLDVASSHSQFVMPLKDQDPVWVVKRVGSLSPMAFKDSTGFDYVIDENAKTAVRRVPKHVSLDDKVFEASSRIKSWSRRPLTNMVNDLVAEWAIDLSQLFRNNSAQPKQSRI